MLVLLTPSVKADSGSHGATSSDTVPVEVPIDWCAGMVVVAVSDYYVRPLVFGTKLFYFFFKCGICMHVHTTVMPSKHHNYSSQDEEQNASNDEDVVETKSSCDNSSVGGRDEAAVSSSHVQDCHKVFQDVPCICVHYTLPGRSRLTLNSGQISKRQAGIQPNPESIPLELSETS